MGLAAHAELSTMAQGDLTEYKQQAKLIFRRVTPQSEPRCSIDSGSCTLQSVSPCLVCPQ